MKRILMTGGAGFIGSAVARHIIKNTPHHVLVFDKLTYAGNLSSLHSLSNNPRYRFIRGDICDAREVKSAFDSFQPDYVMHLAAESHVDRSIDGPGEFIQTNIVGTYVMLDSAHNYWRQLNRNVANEFRFHHISTDEVFGSLGEEGAFREDTPYAPNSPYAASKAGSDHLVRAWNHTYGMPTILTNCSNNYGPYQFPEKLIPLTILNVLEGKPLPVYGRGENVRDWLFVEDHADALMTIVTRGRVGESYNIGGGSERRNIEVVEAVCDLVDEIKPDRNKGGSRKLIEFVADRPGHDVRYAIDGSKVLREVGWRPAQSFEDGLRKTVLWYLENRSWWQRIRSGVYQGERLGARAQA